MHIFLEEVSTIVVLIRTQLYNQNERVLKTLLVLKIPKELKFSILPPYAAWFGMRYVMLSHLTVLQDTIKTKSTLGI